MPSANPHPLDAAARRETLGRLLKDTANADAIYEGFRDRVGDAAANALTTMTFALDAVIVRLNEVIAELDELKRKEVPHV